LTVSAIRVRIKEIGDKNQLKQHLNYQAIPLLFEIPNLQK
jgi:hypothetical protein